MGLEAIDYLLTTYHENLHPRCKRKFFIESVEFVFKNNTMTFDSEFFLQTKGTAMCTVFVWTYATIIMDYVDSKRYIRYDSNHPKTCMHYFRESKHEIDLD